MSEVLRRYVSRDLAKLLHEAPNFTDGPVEMRGTVLVVRIAGFERLAAPDRYAQLPAGLNAYFTHLEAAVRPHGGGLDYAIGCRIQASFGFLFRTSPPETPLAALLAALAILRHDAAPDSLSEWLRAAGAGIALGLATGPCLVGSFGSDTRCFTMPVGEPAERAYTLCDAAGPGELLLDPETLAAARAADPSVIAERELQPRRLTGQQVYGIR